MMTAKVDIPPKSKAPSQSSPQDESSNGYELIQAKPGEAFVLLRKDLLKGEMNDASESKKDVDIEEMINHQMNL